MIDCCIAGKYCKNSNCHSCISMASCSIALYFKEEKPQYRALLGFIVILVYRIGFGEHAISA